MAQRYRHQNLRVATTTSPIAGPVLSVASDITYVRSRTQTVEANSGAAEAVIVLAREVCLFWDNGTVWSDDGQMTIRCASTNSNGVNVFKTNGTTSKSFIIEAGRLGNLRVLQTGSNGLVYVGAFGTSNQTHVFRNILFEVAATAGSDFNFPESQQGCSRVVEGCHVLVGRNAFVSHFTSTSGYSYRTLLIDRCKFEWTNYSGAGGTLINWTAYNANGQECIIRNSEAVGATVTPFTTLGQLAGYQGCQFVAKNLQGFSESLTLINLISYTPATANKEYNTYILLQNVGSNRLFRLETALGVLDWIPADGYPTLDSYLPNGTAWSYRFLYTTNASNFGMYSGGGTPRCILNLTKTNILSAGAKTSTLSFSSMTPTTICSQRATLGLSFPTLPTPTARSGRSLRIVALDTQPMPPFRPAESLGRRIAFRRTLQERCR